MLEIPDNSAPDSVVDRRGIRPAEVCVTAPTVCTGCVASFALIGEGMAAPSNRFAVLATVAGTLLGATSSVAAADRSETHTTNGIYHGVYTTTLSGNDRN